MTSVVHKQKNWTSKPLTFLPPLMNVPWSDGEDADLKRLASEGFSRVEIAGALGRSPMAVQGRCQRLGLRLPRDTYGGFHNVKRYDRPHYENRPSIEAQDRRMVRALAEAIQRGDHLPRASR